MFIGNKWILVLGLCLLVFSDLGEIAAEEVINNKSGQSYSMDFSRKAKEPWLVCAVLPNKLDHYWKDVEDGLKRAAEKSGINLRVIVSNSYFSIEQYESIVMNRCFQEEVRAIILAAVDSVGMDRVIERARVAGIPVIDLINSYEGGVSLHARVNFFDMTYLLMDYLHSVKQGDSEILNILWFPGIEGPEWVSQGEMGMQKIVREGRVNVVERIYVQPFVRDQIKALLGWLKRNKKVKIDYIVGTAPAIEAALQLSDELEGRGIKLASYYYNSKLKKPLSKGVVEAVSFDNSELQAKISIYLAVQAIEDLIVSADMGAKIHVLTKNNIDQHFLFNRP